MQKCVFVISFLSTLLYISHYFIYFKNWEFRSSVKECFNIIKIDLLIGKNIYLI